MDNQASQKERQSSTCNIIGTEINILNGRWITDQASQRDCQPSTSHIDKNYVLRTIEKIFSRRRQCITSWKSGVTQLSFDSCYLRSC